MNVEIFLTSIISALAISLVIAVVISIFILGYVLIKPAFDYFNATSEEEVLRSLAGVFAGLVLALILAATISGLQWYFVN